MTNFKMTGRAEYTVSEYSPLSLSIKSLDQWLSVGLVNFGQELTILYIPCPSVAGFWSKLSLLFTLPLYWLLSGSNWIIFLWHPVWGCTLMISVSWVFLSRTASHDYIPRWLHGALCVANWHILLHSSSCQNYLFWGSSLFLPCLSLAVNLCPSFLEWKHIPGQADSSKIE